MSKDSGTGVSRSKSSTYSSGGTEVDDLDYLHHHEAEPYPYEEEEYESRKDARSHSRKSERSGGHHSSRGGSIGGPVQTQYGKPIEFDPDFHGPIDDRPCTDIVCCVLFVICLAGMAAVSIIGFAHGDPYRLVNPTDSQGKVCGVGALQDKPNLFFFDLVACARLGARVVTGCPTPQVCVKHCPTKTGYYATLTRAELICLGKVDSNQGLYGSLSKDDLVKKDLCASYYLASTAVLGRCMPTVFNNPAKSNAIVDAHGNNITLQRSNGKRVTLKELKDGTVNLLKFFRLRGTAERLVNDIMKSSHLIGVCLLGAVLLSLIWIILLRWVTTIAVWLSIFLFISLFGCASGYSFYMFSEVHGTNSTDQKKVLQDMKLDLDYFMSMERTWLVLGVISSSILLIFILTILFLRSRVVLATNLIAEASVAVSHMWSVLLWPLIPFLMQFVVIIYWVTSMVFIASMGEKQFFNGTNGTLDRVPCEPQGNSTINELCAFVKYGGSTYKTLLVVWVSVMCFWLINFVLALEQMTLAGAFASYYWAWDKSEDIPLFPLFSSLYRTLRYHTGSLALGSLLISFVQIVVTVLEYTDRTLQGSESDMAHFLEKCLICCFWLLDEFLQYINKNAFIEIAIHGRSFCIAAKDGFELVMRNALRAAILDKISDFLMFVSKLVVTVASGVAAYLWFSKEFPIAKEHVPQLNYFMSPVIVVILATYLIADNFFDVYSMAVDTIFLCFLEDIERNDGSRKRPYYMTRTQNLSSFLKNKFNSDASRKGDNALDEEENYGLED